MMAEITFMMGAKRVNSNSTTALRRWTFMRSAVSLASSLGIGKGSICDHPERGCSMAAEVAARVAAA